MSLMALHLGRLSDWARPTAAKTTSVMKILLLKKVSCINVLKYSIAMPLMGALLTLFCTLHTPAICQDIILKQGLKVGGEVFMRPFLLFDWMIKTFILTVAIPHVQNPHCVKRQCCKCSSWFVHSLLKSCKYIQYVVHTEISYFLSKLLLPTNFTHFTQFLRQCFCFWNVFIIQLQSTDICCLFAVIALLSWSCKPCQSVYFELCLQM